LAFDAGITLGTSDFGLSLGIHIHVFLDQNPETHFYRFGVSADGFARLRAFGFTFASVTIGFSLSAEGAGRVPVTVNAHASISFLFFDVSVSMSFTLGYIELPKPVFLAADLGDGSIQSR